MKAVRFLVLSAVALWLPLSSCSNYQQQAGLIGGLTGAGLGAAFGDDHQDVVAGAAVGAALGAGGAALHEQSRRQQLERYGIPPGEARQRIPAGRTSSQPPPRRQMAPAVDPEPTPEYPLALQSEKPDEVRSPFAPHHRINVSGFRSGQLAKDPKNGKIFRVP